MITTLDKWENLKISNNIIVASFIQIVHKFINDLKKAYEISFDLVIIQKILKIFLLKYKSLICIIRNEKNRPTFTKIAYYLYIEEIEMKI